MPPSDHSTLPNVLTPKCKNIPNFRCIYSNWPALGSLPGFCAIISDFLRMFFDVPVQGCPMVSGCGASYTFTPFLLEFFT